MSADAYELEYSCRGCGLDRVSFRVRHRGATEDLIAWMDEVVRPAMGADHAKRSPLCVSSHCDLRMPISEAADGIGKQVKH